MDNRVQSEPGEQILESMIEIARCATHQRIILAGPNGPRRMFVLHRRGFARVATTSTCGLPRGQYEAAFVEWPLHSVRALHATLDWLVHFLSPTGVLVIWMDADACTDRPKLRPVLERLGFHCEAGTRCEHGFVLSARRLDVIQQAAVIRASGGHSRIARSRKLG
jgi:hypothetical protein